MISYQYLCVNISQESFSTLLSDSPYSFRGVFSSRSTSAAFPASAAPETDAAPSDNDSSAQNILIAYFSNTGNTEEAAQQIADLTGGTLAEIQRAEDYDTIFVGYPCWTTGFPSPAIMQPTRKVILPTGSPVLISYNPLLWLRQFLRQLQDLRSQFFAFPSRNRTV